MNTTSPAIESVERRPVLKIALIITLALTAITAESMFASRYLYHTASVQGAAYSALQPSPEPQPQLQPDLTMVAVGDIFFDRHIRQVGEREGGDFIFSCVEDLFRSADLVIGNLEGPVTAQPSVSVGTPIGSPQNYQFTFPTTTAALLAKYNVQVVNLGNNHIGNFGIAGIASTHTFLSTAGIGYFGGLDGNEPVFRTEMNGIKLSFVSYNQFGGSSPEKVAVTIAQEHLEGRVVIVYAHWGEEYSESLLGIREVAELFAEQGADAIIGSHPHIVLPHEYIGNTLVYYSLGNFIFDQYWNTEVNHGLALLLHLGGSSIIADEYPVVLGSDGRTCPA